MLHSAPLHMDEILKNELGSINSHTWNYHKNPMPLVSTKSKTNFVWKKNKKGISNSYENQKHNLYLEMHNCGLDKPSVVVKVIESLPLFYLQALLRQQQDSQELQPKSKLIYMKIKAS